MTKGRQQLSDSERRAIVWDTIERLAFRPQKPSRWLGVYAKTLHRLWEVEPVWARLGTEDSFAVDFLDLECCYALPGFSEYSASISRRSSGATVWQIHVDPDFLSKAALHHTPGSYPHQAVQSHLQCDVEQVLDGMLIHPRNHTHIGELGDGVAAQPDTANGDSLPLHEVRIGGGIENSYVFLFHLRYQFCRVSDRVRHKERTRLIRLFTRAMRDNWQTVSPGDLFDFRW